VLPIGRTRRWLCLAASPLLIGVAACGSSSSPAASGSDTAANHDPYEVGFTGDLTGPIAFAGTGTQLGVQAWVAKVNAKGGINGHPVHLTSLDDQTKADRESANAIQLITQNNVSVITGPISSGIYPTVLAAVKPRNVPILSTALPPANVNPADPLSFLMEAFQPDEARPMFDLGKSKASSSSPKFAVFNNTNSAIAPVLGQNIINIGQASGWQMATHQTNLNNDADQSAQIGNILSAKPDILFLVITDPQIQQVVRGLASAGLNIPIVTYTSPATATIAALKSPNLFVTQSYGDPVWATGQGITDFVDAIKAVGGDPEKQFANRGYLEGLVIEEAFKKCGFPCSGSQMAAALNTVNLDTRGLTAGPVKFSATNHIAVSSLSAIAWDTAANKIVQIKANLAGGAS
jgi:branched-chain amino acid transport system substrate-binding protein